MLRINRSVVINSARRVLLCIRKRPCLVGRQITFPGRGRAQSRKTEPGLGLRFKLRTITQPLPKEEETCASLTPVSSLGGSIRDDESIAAANENGIAMAFAGISHF